MIKINIENGYVPFGEFHKITQNREILSEKIYSKFFTLEDVKEYIEEFKASDNYIPKIHTEEFFKKFLGQYENYDFNKEIGNILIAKTSQNLTIKSRYILIDECIEDYLEFLGEHSRVGIELARREYQIQRQEELEKQRQELIAKTKELLLEDINFHSKLKINERKAYVKENHSDFYEAFEDSALLQAQRNMIFEEILNQK